MNIDNYLIEDLLHENKMFFAKNEQLKSVKKDEISKLFQKINYVSSLDTNDELHYLGACRELFIILFNIIRITSNQNDLLKKIKSNLNEIERLKGYGSNEKTN